MVRWVFPCMAFISGFSVMAVQMLGGRILAPWFGGSIYIWGSIITTFLVALAVGYLSGGKLSLHNPTIRKYGMLFLAAGLSLLPLVFFSDALIDFSFEMTEDPRYASLIASFLLFFIPAGILGMISPYSIRMMVTSEVTSGFSAGLLYFVSTLGSALGTIGTAFYFVLYFEINHIMLTTCLAVAIPGTICLFFNWSPQDVAS